jgi:hypothetical protein
MDNLIVYRRPLPQGGEEHCVLHTRNPETLRELMPWLDARLAATDAMQKPPTPTPMPPAPDDEPIVPDSSWRQPERRRRGRPFQYVRVELEAFDLVYAALKRFAPTLVDVVLAGLAPDGPGGRGLESETSSQLDETPGDA